MSAQLGLGKADDLDLRAVAVGPLTTRSHSQSAELEMPPLWASEMFGVIEPAGSTTLPTTPGVPMAYPWTNVPEQQARNDEPAVFLPRAAPSDADVAHSLLLGPQAADGTLFYPPPPDSYTIKTFKYLKPFPVSHADNSNFK